ncbi:hypothetical protein SS50377_21819 [Spironucleus salmonicida]|uniref:Uncharacterized protein n=1 Tax=Spironucleus salmonicida TaxID=348837 RepID=V6LVG4_9EUKA|nr:hypothetical protein SS50377_21819 [Spironucleus salmonicida]|eukprot:EST44794.1 Hypothetical protein SS50377_15302 [Spironucleus salmonicida]
MNLRGFRKLLLLATKSVLKNDLTFQDVFTSYPNLPTPVTPSQPQPKNSSIYSVISIQSQIQNSSRLSNKSSQPIVQYKSSPKTPQPKNYLKTTFLNKLQQQISQILFQHFHNAILPKPFANEQTFSLYISALLTLSHYKIYTAKNLNSQYESQSLTQFSLQNFLQPMFSRQQTKDLLKIATAADKIQLGQEFGISIDQLDEIENWIQYAFSVQVDSINNKTPDNDNESVYVDDNFDDFLFFEEQDFNETQLNIIARNITITQQNQIVKKSVIYEENNVDPFSRKKGNRRSRIMK